MTVKYTRDELRRRREEQLQLEINQAAAQHQMHEDYVRDLRENAELMVEHYAEENGYEFTDAEICKLHNVVSNPHWKAAIDLYESMLYHAGKHYCLVCNKHDLLDKAPRTIDNAATALQMAGLVVIDKNLIILDIGKYMTEHCATAMVIPDLKARMLQRYKR